MDEKEDGVYCKGESDDIAMELILCLDWACVDTRIHRLPSPAGLDGGVTVERHKSLNWPVGSEERADWDDVGTNT